MSGPKSFAWMDDAACVKAIEDGRAHASDWHSKQSRWPNPTAIEICGACPVLTECRDYVDAVERDLPQSVMYLGAVFAGEGPTARADRRAGR